MLYLLPLGRPPLVDDAPLKEWRERIAREVKTLFALLRRVGGELREGAAFADGEWSGRYLWP